MKKAFEVIKNENLSAEEKYEILLDLGLDPEDMIELILQE